MSSESFQAPSLEYLGQLLPQYAFESFIAQGGMGAVYKANQLSLDRDVAIKVLPHELGEDEEFRESFDKEAKAMARLNHPNLIGVFDSGTVDGMPYIVMEYIEGSSLHDACHGQVVESAQAVAIVKGICLGLADAHEHGIIHRDIKPANILLTAKAEPKIGDFGLAHPSDSDESGLVMGTPGYTAPEIFIDPDQAGVLADQYSVGMILHQLLTGIDPAGTEGPPTQLSGSIRLDAIWRKATQSDPSKRYPTMAAMAEDLQKWENSKSAAPAVGRAIGGRMPTIKPSMIAPKKSGGGVLIKMILVGALLVGAWFALQKIQDSNNPILDDSDDTELPGTADAPGKPDPAPPAPKPTHPNQGSKPKSPTKPEAQDMASAPKPAPKPNPVDPKPRAPKTPAKPPARADIPPGDPELREKAVALILDARKRRNALLGKNTSGFTLILDREAATAGSSEAERYVKLRRDCEDGWIPEPNNTPQMNRVVSQAYETAYREQNSIQAKYMAELTRLRDFYVPNLQKAAKETSDPELKKRLEAQADRATDISSWVEKLAPEPEHGGISLLAPIVKP